ncbi:MAG: hypothetical protein M3O30_14250 [Planctomycetota bacterium]|nr:hypothetical protein [Planctomycetota bacterium]
MGNLWLKIKIWSKIGSLSLLVIYLLIFIFENANKPISVWIWFGHEPSSTVLRLILSMLLAGIVGTVLVRTAFTTIRQVRDLQHRTRSAQMAKDVADLRTKAAMLQTKAPGSAAPPNSNL